MRMIDVKIIKQAGVKIVGGIKVPPFEKAASQDTQPPLHLIEPGAMGRRKVQDVWVRRIAQQCPPVDTARERLGGKGRSHHWATRRHTSHGCCSSTEPAPSLESV